MNRHTRLELVVGLIISSADCGDFFNYTSNSNLNGGYDVTIGTLFVFSISIIQFSLTMTTVRQRRPVIVNIETKLQYLH